MKKCFHIVQNEMVRDVTFVKKKPVKNYIVNIVRTLQQILNFSKHIIHKHDCLYLWLNVHQQYKFFPICKIWKNANASQGNGLGCNICDKQLATKPWFSCQHCQSNFTNFSRHINNKHDSITKFAYQAICINKAIFQILHLKNKKV